MTISKSCNYLYIDSIGQIQKSDGLGKDSGPSTLRALRDKAIQCYQSRFSEKQPLLGSQKMEALIDHIHVINSKIDSYNSKLTSGCLGFLFAPFKMDKIDISAYEAEKKEIKKEKDDRSARVSLETETLEATPIKIDEIDISENMADQEKEEIDRNTRLRLEAEAWEANPLVPYRIKVEIKDALKGTRNEYLESIFRAKLLELSSSQSYISVVGEDVYLRYRDRTSPTISYDCTSKEFFMRLEGIHKSQVQVNGIQIHDLSENVEPKLQIGKNDISYIGLNITIEIIKK